MKDIGELFLCRGSHLTIRTPDHKPAYVVVLESNGTLSFIRAGSDVERGNIFAEFKPEDPE
jgi:hypothetical protein